MKKELISEKRTIITREGYFDRRIDFVGNTKYFYTIVDSSKEGKTLKGREDCDSLEFLFLWEEKK